MSTGHKISLAEEEDGGWSAIDEEIGVVIQGSLAVYIEEDVTRGTASIPVRGI